MNVLQLTWFKAWRTMILNPLRAPRQSIPSATLTTATQKSQSMITRTTMRRRNPDLRLELDALPLCSKFFETMLWLKNVLILHRLNDSKSNVLFKKGLKQVREDGIPLAAHICLPPSKRSIPLNSHTAIAAPACHLVCPRTWRSSKAAHSLHPGASALENTRLLPCSARGNRRSLRWLRLPRRRWSD